MDETEKRIETKISRTAEFTCLSRAASFYEKNLIIKVMIP